MAKVELVAVAFQTSGRGRRKEVEEAVERETLPESTVDTAVNVALVAQVEAAKQRGSM